MICFPTSKINIGLNIVSKREDGYHDIETVFYPISLSDILEIIEDPNIPEGSCKLIVSGIPVSGDPSENLVVKAYRLMNQQKPLPGVSVYLHKIVPPGAGLGGGSSDASFMLTALNSMFHSGFTPIELEKMAASIGSDCPFFVKNNPVFAYERGDKFKTVELKLGGFFLLIVWPGIHVSTPEAYASALPVIPEKSLDVLVTYPVKTWKDTIINDFELNVFKKYPEIKEIKDILYQLGALYASMSGSGSAVYGLFSVIPTNLELINDYFNWCGRMM